jgi:esterase/lipase superfamily enzyme
MERPEDEPGTVNEEKMIAFFHGAGIARSARKGKRSFANIREIFAAISSHFTGTPKRQQLAFVSCTLKNGFVAFTTTRKMRRLIREIAQRCNISTFRQIDALAIRILVLFAVLILSACAKRPGVDVLSSTPVSLRDQHIVTVYVATSRQRAAPGKNVFTSERSNSLNFAEFKISIPADHKSGQIEWPQGKPNPGKDFVTVEQHTLDQATFIRAVARSSGGKKDNIGIFVHGYNTSFQEALFRQAQVAADAGTGDAVLFSWPSEATYSGYLADREAATASRDQLVEFLTAMSREPGAGHIALVGHSMGGWLVTEAIRQLRLMGRNSVIDKLRVILASPDIDGEVFETQMNVIGSLSPPLVVLVSTDDIALNVSSKLSNGRLKLGQLDINNPQIAAAARKAHVQVIDISSLTTDDTFKHDRFATLAALYPKLSKSDAESARAQARQAGVFVLDAVSATITAPLVITQRAISGR